MADYYDWEGNEITMQQWTVLFYDERHIGDDRVGEHHISTVYLGVSHQFGDGPPLIFETLILDGPYTDAMWRWATEKEARIGHRLILDALCAEQDPNNVVRR